MIDRTEKAIEAAVEVLSLCNTCTGDGFDDEGNKCPDCFGSGTDIRRAIAAYEAAMWGPIEEMKRDSTFYLIEVEATDETHNPLEEDDVFVTIGCNGFDDDGIDEWKLSGWNWSHDCLMECSGVIPRRFRAIPRAPSLPENEK